MVDASTFTGAVFLNQLLASVEDEKYAWRGYVYAACIFIGLLIGTLCDAQHFQRVMRAGYRLRSIITTEVQRKALYMSPTDRSKFSAGQIFNFVASDSESLQMVCMNSLGLISAPLRMIGATVMLYFQLGASSLVAVAALCLIVPIQTAMVKLSSRFIRQALQETDERSKLEGELVAGMPSVRNLQ